MQILNINEKDKESIRKGNTLLLKNKLKLEEDKWRKSVLLGREDHRFSQGIYCTLLDILELLES